MAVMVAQQLLSVAISSNAGRKRQQRTTLPVRMQSSAQGQRRILLGARLQPDAEPLPDAAVVIVGSSRRDGLGVRRRRRGSDIGRGPLARQGIGMHARVRLQSARRKRSDRLVVVEKNVPAYSRSALGGS